MSAATDWHEMASCRSHPYPNLWFSDDLAKIRKAQEVCAGCPVAEPCSQGARRRRERYGVWAGVDFGARERARKLTSHVKREVA